MILHMENLKDATKKLLELINEFGKVAGYKISMQKLVAFLYTNNKLSERKIKKIIPFTIVSKIIKYLEINITTEVKDLYLENYKTLMKEIEDDTNRWKNILCSWIERNNIVRDFPGGAVVKNLPANTGDTGSSPGPGRSHMPRSN